MAIERLEGRVIVPALEKVNSQKKTIFYLCCLSGETVARGYVAKNLRNRFTPDPCL